MRRKEVRCKTLDSELSYCEVLYEAAELLVMRRAKGG